MKSLLASRREQARLQIRRRHNDELIARARQVSEEGDLAFEEEVPSQSSPVDSSSMAESFRSAIRDKLLTGADLTQTVVSLGDSFKDMTLTDRQSLLPQLLPLLSAEQLGRLDREVKRKLVVTVVGLTVEADLKDLGLVQSLNDLLIHEDDKIVYSAMLGLGNMSEGDIFLVQNRMAQRKMLLLSGGMFFLSQYYCYPYRTERPVPPDLPEQCLQVLASWEQLQGPKGGNLLHDTIKVLRALVQGYGVTFEPDLRVMVEMLNRGGPFQKSLCNLLTILASRLKLSSRLLQQDIHSLLVMRLSKEEYALLLYTVLLEPLNCKQFVNYIYSILHEYLHASSKALSALIFDIVVLVAEATEGSVFQAVVQTLSGKEPDTPEQLKDLVVLARVALDLNPYLSLSGWLLTAVESFDS